MDSSFYFKGVGVKKKFGQQVPFDTEHQHFSVFEIKTTSNQHRRRKKGCISWAVTVDESKLVSKLILNVLFVESW